jgi:hypothetical protein
MSNSSRRGTRSRDNEGRINSVEKHLQKVLPAPYISGFEVDSSNALALIPAGGETVYINGNGFESGLTLSIGGVSISPVSVLSDKRISFTSPANSSGTYSVLLINPSGGAAVLVPGIQYSGSPNFVTATGNIGNFYETTAISSSVSAASDSAITYDVVSGLIPPGSTLNNDGTLTGTAQATTTNDTYTFTVRATDAELQTSTREFNVTVNTDVVIWSYPTNGSTININANTASVNLNASALTGYDIDYTASALPSGFSLNAETGVISGTVTQTETVPANLTATAETSNRSSTISITWAVILGDIFFKDTVLLISGDTGTNPFLADESNNAFQIVKQTPFENPKAVSFSPFNTGYSVYFDGTDDFIDAPSNSVFTMGTGDFTIEGWLYLLSGTSGTLYDGRTGSTTISPVIYLNAGVLTYFVGNNRIAGATLSTSRWYHIAVVKSSGSTKMYLDGTQTGSTYTDANDYVIGGPKIGCGYLNANDLNGYISNLRVVKGRAVYTTTFTPPTAPLGITSGGVNPPQGTETSLLTCQNGNIVDNSSYKLNLTKSGEAETVTFSPFANTDITSGSGYFANSTSQYVSIPTTATGFSDAFLMGSSDFTFEAWVYSNVAFSAIRGIASTWSGGGAWIWRITTASKIEFVLRKESDGGTATLTSTDSVPYNTWVHLAVVRSGNSIYFYINGKSDSGGARTFADTNIWFSGFLKEFRIGVQGDTTDPWSGFISNFRIVKGVAVYTGDFTPPIADLLPYGSSTPYSVTTNVNTTFSASSTSILTLKGRRDYNNKVAFDKVNSHRIISFSGDVATSTFTPFSHVGWSNYFDGTGDYLSIAAANALWTAANSFTIEMWAKVDSLASNRVFFARDANSSGSGIRGLSIAALTTGALQIFYSITGTSEATIASSTGIITTSGWYHIAFVKNGSACNLYLNGSSVISFTAATIASPTAQISYIGSLTGSTAFMLGNISNFRVVNGTAVYTGTFTPPTSPLSRIQSAGTNISALTGSETTLLTCQSNRFVDNSNNSFILTASGTVATQPFTPFAPSTQYDELTNGTSCYFDGSNDLLTTVNEQSSLSLGTGDFTIESWIYPTNTAAVSRMIFNFWTSSATNSYQLFLRSSNRLAWQIYTHAATDVAALFVPYNAWAHVVWTRISGTCRVYINGVLQNINATGTNSANGTGSPRIGSDGTNHFRGYIFDLRIVKGVGVYTGGSAVGDVVFTPPIAPLNTHGSNSISSYPNTNNINTTFEECVMLTNFDSAAMKDFTTKSTIYSDVTNARVSSQLSKWGKTSLFFDGTVNNRLKIAHLPYHTFSLKNFTIDMWIYIIAGNSGNLINKGASTPTGWALSLSATNQVVFTNVSTAITTTTTISTGVWTHIAVVRSGIGANQFNIYIDGTVSATGTVSTDFNQTDIIYLGAARGGGASYFNGYISDLRVTLYDRTIVVPTAPLLLQ